MAEAASIWIGQDVRNAQDAQHCIEDLWPPGGRTKGAGGRGFRLLGAGPVFSTAQLQQFTDALAAELRYQCIEIFLAPPCASLSLRSTPVLVAGSYRRTDLYGPPTNPKSRLRQGVYPLAHPYVAKLRRLLLSGEEAEAIIRRMRTFEHPQEGAYDLIEHVLYSAIGTVVAMLADAGPSLYEGAAPFLWELITAATGLDNQIPARDVREALRHIIAHQGEILLEDEALASVIKEQVLEKSETIASGSKVEPEDIDRALGLWTSLSLSSKRVEERLRKEVWRLPSSVVRLLFEAHARSYPPWLHSASLEVETTLIPVLHGDLRLIIERYRGKRNKRVNIPTLEAYEAAARHFLISECTGKNRQGVLKSMFLVPFDANDDSGCWRAQGFVRFMNRFTGGESGPNFFRYPQEGNHWQPAVDEIGLCTAVTSLLRTELQHMGYFPKAQGTLLPLVRDVVVGDMATSPRAELPEPKGGAVPILRFGSMVGGSPPMQRVYEMVNRWGPTETPVLIEGASGTGKELVARALHFASKRCNGPFVKIDCTTLAETLFESELFGHVRGAFTGANRDKTGLIVLADNGTLFLDEIGELPLTLQGKLLQVLESGELRPVGSTRSLRSTFRLLAATNRGLANEVAKGSFRLDLYYRIYIGHIQLPSLHARSEDVPLLIRHYLSELASQGKASSPGVTDAVLEALCAWHWPGNIRELKHLIERAAALAGGSFIDQSHVPAEYLTYAERKSGGNDS